MQALVTNAIPTVMRFELLLRLKDFFVLDGETRKVIAGDTVVIKKTQMHAFKAISRITFIEVQTGSHFVEEDIERFEWTWM